MFIDYARQITQSSDKERMFLMSLCSIGKSSFLSDFGKVYSETNLSNDNQLKKKIIIDICKASHGLFLLPASFANTRCMLRLTNS